jgi:mitotic spindle assembly checkpoint protein MAD2B
MATASPRKAQGQHPTTTSATSLTFSDASELLSSFTNFLTLALHSLLFHRSLYPAATFLTARAYNLPVQQSRHPGLCAWIRDAVAAVAGQLRDGRAERVVVVLHAPGTLRVIERWVFDVGSFPADWGKGAVAASGAGEEDEGGRDYGDDDDDDEDDGDVVEMEEPDGEGGEGEGAADTPDEAMDDEAADDEDDSAINWVDVNEALRGALRRIAYAAESLPDPPQGATFTVAVELRDGAPAPIKHPQHWIPSPGAPKQLRSKSSGPGKRPLPSQGATTTPVRSVRAGPLFFECWIEQANMEEPRDSEAKSISKNSK